MAVQPDPVGCGADGLAVLLPEDGGVGHGVDSAHQLHLIPRLRVDEHLLHLYLWLEQHLQLDVLENIEMEMKGTVS